MEKISSFLGNETVRVAADDILKIGAMILMARLFSKQTVMDKQWISVSLYILLGFAVYHILIRHIVNPYNYVDMTAIRYAVDDFIKFGIVLIIVRLAMYKNIGSLTDSTWLKQTGVILGGFAIYDIVVAKIVEKLNIPLNANHLVVFNDVVKFGTMFATLKWFSDGNLADPDWLKEVGAALAGLAIYHYVSQNAIKLSFNF
jgi:hypothetical protein